MFVTGNQFVFVYTRDVCHSDVKKAVKRLCRGEDIGELHPYVYTEIKDIPELWYEIDLPAHSIYGMSKITYQSPTHYSEYDIEEIFAAKIIDHYVDLYCDMEYIDSVLPMFCRDTKAYEQYLIAVKEAEELAREKNALRAWHQACCLH